MKYLYSALIAFILFITPMNVQMLNLNYLKFFNQHYFNVLNQ